MYIYTGIQCIVKGSHTILNILHCVFGACVRDVCAFSSFGICATAACVTRGACQKQVYSSTFLQELALHTYVCCGDAGVDVMLMKAKPQIPSAATSHFTCVAETMAISADTQCLVQSGQGRAWRTPSPSPPNVVKGAWAHSWRARCAARVGAVRGWMRAESYVQKRIYH